VLAVLGPNGAGKTTLLNGVMGLAKVKVGRICFNGADIGGLAPEQAAARGIAYVPQGRWLFPYATGSVNVWSGGYPRADRRHVDAEVKSFFNGWQAAKPLARRRAGLMSGGQQQLIAVGRALTARPVLLLLDEPSLGLAPVLVKEVFEMIAQVADGLISSGGAVILVEQNVEAALAIASSICVLSGGAAVYQGASTSLSAERIGELYLS
jgi:branched-chain amino acid transport system ATP-binding protein